ncbi:hypothetical protein [Bailinhaonella thermotolerans]|uniref:Uncharacterized protein n=1 Tax=Bailinhaonella thermotolerans TaxID=1070861 RepID=A0A3A4B317_9ACTN|nr:hypothetical protein [Bailinhaonella thermotolerans]RJL35551.1 hypothetical protein D5H75_01770 [Bailinhaonella thermotolerans]
MMMRKPTAKTALLVFLGAVALAGMAAPARSDTASASRPGASAAADGAWRAYGNVNPITSSTSTWGCAASKAIAVDVVAQVCAVRAQHGGAVQGAVIVRNNRSTRYDTAAGSELFTYGEYREGYWVCPVSGVAPHSWSVCFGTTLPLSVLTHARGWAAYTDLETSPYV